MLFFLGITKLGVEGISKTHSHISVLLQGRYNGNIKPQILKSDHFPFSLNILFMESGNGRQKYKAKADNTGEPSYSKLSVMAVFKSSTCSWRVPIAGCRAGFIVLAGFQPVRSSAKGAAPLPPGMGRFFWNLDWDPNDLLSLDTH